MKKKAVDRGASWCRGPEPGMVLFLCHFSLNPSPQALAVHTAKASTAAQVPLFSIGKLTQGAVLFSGSVQHLLHRTGLFLSARYRLSRKETEGARKQHESRKWGGKGETPLETWVLTDNDKSHQGWLTEESIYT